MFAETKPMDEEGKLQLGGGSQLFLSLVKGESKWPLTVVPNKNEGAKFELVDERPVRVSPFTSLEVRGAAPGAEYYAVVADADEHVSHAALTAPVLLVDKLIQGAVNNGRRHLPSLTPSADPLYLYDVRQFRYVKFSLQRIEGTADYVAQTIIPYLYGLDARPTETEAMTWMEHVGDNMAGPGGGAYGHVTLGEAEGRTEPRSLVVPVRFGYVAAAIDFASNNAGTEMDVGAGLRAQLWGYR